MNSYSHTGLNTGMHTSYNLLACTATKLFAQIPLIHKLDQIVLVTTESLKSAEDRLCECSLYPIRPNQAVDTYHDREWLGVRGVLVLPRHALEEFADDLVELLHREIAW